MDSILARVYYYSGAAPLTSGSQNATNSFSLNSGNKNAKDILAQGGLSPRRPCVVGRLSFYTDAIVSSSGDCGGRDGAGRVDRSVAVDDRDAFAAVRRSIGACIRLGMAPKIDAEACLVA